MIVFAAQINPILGDVRGNCEKIAGALARARMAGADVVLTPELCLTGYPPEDLLLDSEMIDACERALETLVKLTKGMMAVVGTPRRNPSGVEKGLFNSAAVMIDGRIVGYQDKRLLPTYDVFDDRRYFEPGRKSEVWEYLGRRIAITLCEDLWQHAEAVGYTHYASDPVLELKGARIDLLLNLSASPYHFQKRDLRQKVFGRAAAALQVPLIVCNQVAGHDALIFDGCSFYLNERGELLQMARGFCEDDLVCDLELKACSAPPVRDPIGELYQALVLGVRDYFHKQGFKRALVGLSGGVDSAVVACVAVEALGRGSVKMLYLPSRFSSKQSGEDAAVIAERLGGELETISIEPLFESYLELLRPTFKGRPFDVTEENLQARIRGMILMAYSNKWGPILLNTSNKSEWAMGYTTLYGDMCGGLAVLCDVLKDRVYQLARYINREKEVIPERVLTRPPTAELRENQTDQDTLPPFEVLDPILRDYVEEMRAPEDIAKRRGVDVAFVRDIVRRVHAAEYKRRQAAVGLRVTQRAFAKGRYVPIVQKWVAIIS